MNVHRRRRRRYLGIDLILDTGGVFGSLPPLALPRVIGGDAGVVERCRSFFVGVTNNVVDSFPEEDG